MIIKWIRDHVRREYVFSLVRNLYFVVAISYMGYSSIGTMHKMVDNRIVASISEHEFSTFTFPSITFCHPFIDFGHEIIRIVLKLKDDHGK